MTLRARITGLTTALLAAVLLAAGVVLWRVEAESVERKLENRVRELAGKPLPPPPLRSTGTAPTSGARGSEPRTVVLGAEPDGARAEVFEFDVAVRSDGPKPTLEARASTGAPRLDPALASARAATVAPGRVRTIEADGAEWRVAAANEPARFPRGGPPPPPPPRGPGEDGGADPPPPPPPPDDAGDDPRPRPTKRVTVAFLEAGPAWAEHRSFLVRLGGVGVAALLFGGLFAFLLAGRMLKPVREAAAAAEAIDRVDQRLPKPASKDELERLVVVLNGMLERIEASTERERLFLATASHELRRPLTALLGELELATTPGRDVAEVKDSAALAMGDAKAMHRLVEDLLHHARARAGMIRLVEGEVDLLDLVGDAVERSRRVVPGGLRVKIGDLPLVSLKVDADALRQALENLLVNSGVHGGEGVRVDVSAEIVGEVLEIHVDDDGPGLSAEESAKVFEPFARGDRARGVPGFGLGLAIARDMVEAHAVWLSVTSPRIPGAERPGSRWTLHLPASRVVSPAPRTL